MRHHTSGPSSAVGGGDGNTASGTFFGGGAATVGGGYHNAASGNLATVPGGENNTAAGDYSFAAGRNAKANHEGSFVWADSIIDDFASTDRDQFLIRATRGVGIGTSSPEAQLHVVTQKGASATDNTASFYAPNLGPDSSHIHWGLNGDWYIRSATASGKVIVQDFGGNVGIGTDNPTARLHLGLLSNSGTQPPQIQIECRTTGPDIVPAIRLNRSDDVPWDIDHFGALSFSSAGVPAMLIFADGSVYADSFNETSDRAAKERFAAVDGRKILECVASLPIETWSFKKDKSTRHIGPMAQDFYAAFKVGVDDKHIAMVDADGVALAAIQGLHTLVREQELQIQSLQAGNSALQKQLVTLQSQMAAQQSASARWETRFTTLEKALATRHAQPGTPALTVSHSKSEEQ